ncbi:MAG TPA: glycosyltransferase 87 family protein [Solirubrobacteraceae bacterium]|nr:glycosyltransferase 87 family protein [Solirubrobacteraceae bacterium]
MSPAAYRTVLWGLLGAGLAVRLGFAFTTDGVKPDLESFRIVADALRAAPGHVYEIANANPPFVRWPYPSGYLPFVAGADRLADATGLDFLAVIRLGPIAADLALAAVVQAFMGRRGHGPGTRLAATALIALGPPFVAVSGHHGQIDAVAILPAVVALVVWERTDAQWRGVAAGALIGLGASVKTIPLLMALALLPSARSWREAISLTGCAAAVPLLAVAPWIVSEGTDWLRVFRYNGAPGLGSLSLLAQPDLAPAWFGLGDARPNGFSQALFDASRAIAGASLLVVAALLLRFRAAAPLAAVAVWLGVYAFGVTFFMQYAVWGIPFFLMAGYVRHVLALELVLLAPILVTYADVASETWQVYVLYVGPMLLVWAAMTLALVALLRGLAVRPPGTPRPRPGRRPAPSSAA